MPDANFTVHLDKHVLDGLIQELPDKLAEFMDTEAEEIVNDIKASFGPSPSLPGEPPGIDTGQLTGSMDWDPEGDFRRIVHDGKEYGIYLEMGTRHMAPRPFVGPAFERARRGFGMRLKEDLSR